MIDEALKRIEENGINLLSMRAFPARPDLHTEIKELLRDVFLAEHTMLSDITLDRMTRYLVNYVKDADNRRRNADEILLLVFQSLRFEQLIKEYKEIVK